MPLSLDEKERYRWRALTDAERTTEAGAVHGHRSRTYDELVALGRIIEFPALPDCDICIHVEHIFNPTLVGRAEADSATKLGKWGYTCSKHKDWRVGQITWLVAVGESP